MIKQLSIHYCFPCRSVPSAAPPYCLSFSSKQCCFPEVQSRSLSTDIIFFPLAPFALPHRSRRQESFAPSVYLSLWPLSHSRFSYDAPVGLQRLPCFHYLCPTRDSEIGGDSSGHHSVDWWILKYLIVEIRRIKLIPSHWLRRNKERASNRKDNETLKSCHLLSFKSIQPPWPLEYYNIIINQLEYNNIWFHLIA